MTDLRIDEQLNALGVTSNFASASVTTTEAPAETPAPKTRKVKTDSVKPAATPKKAKAARTATVALIVSNDTPVASEQLGEAPKAWAGGGKDATKGDERKSKASSTRSQPKTDRAQPTLQTSDDKLSLAWEGQILFTIPANSKVVGEGSNRQILVPFGKDQNVIVGGNGVQDIDLSTDVDVIGLLKLRRDPKKLRCFGPVTLVLANYRRPGFELVIGNAVGAVYSKAIPSGALSIVRLAPAQQAEPAKQESAIAA